MPDSLAGGNRLDQPSRWIVAVASILVVSLTTWFFNSLLGNLKETTQKLDLVDRRLIAVETQVTAVHLQMVDVPNLKLEQARQDLRLKNLEAQMRTDNRQGNMQ